MIHEMSWLIAAERVIGKGDEMLLHNRLNGSSNRGCRKRDISQDVQRDPVTVGTKLKKKKPKKPVEYTLQK